MLTVFYTVCRRRYVLSCDSAELQAEWMQALNANCKTQSATAGHATPPVARHA